MRKPVFKRKKVIEVHKKNKFYRLVSPLAAVMAVVCLLPGMMLTVYGEEKEKTEVTNICHRHIGNPDVFGGCYTESVAHVHIGDEENGGECFQIPVLHEHQGDPVSGGGCYVKPVPHVHQDSCYDTHTHRDVCFETISCQEIRTQVEPYGTGERKCATHGMTTFILANSILVHSACGAEPSSSDVEYCQICNSYQNTWHTVKNKLCDYEEGDIDFDNIICGKEDGNEIDGYEKDCGFEQGQTEKYEKSCNKETDGYKVGCGLKKDELLGKLILTSKVSGEKAQITAQVENSSGKLVLSDTPFVWQDAAGSVIGGGDRIEVKENGSYFVTLHLVNKDVDESGLRSSIVVEGIYKEETKPTPTPAGTPDAVKTPGVSPKPSDNKENNSGRDDEKKDEKDEKDDKEKDKYDNDNDDGGDGDGGDDLESKRDTQEEKQEKTPGEIPFDENLNSIAGNYSGRKSSENAVIIPTPSASPGRQLEKETVRAEPRENKTVEKAPIQVQQAEKKSSIFDLPAARVITITAGALFVIAVIWLLFAYLRHSVKVYNDDGEGKMHYLGRCLVHREDDEYFLAISDGMVEKSYTNRYCIKPGLFRLGKNEDEELVVYKETKKAVAPLSREMIIML